MQYNDEKELLMRFEMPIGDVKKKTIRGQTATTIMLLVGAALAIASVIGGAGTDDAPILYVTSIASIVLFVAGVVGYLVCGLSEPRTRNNLFSDLKDEIERSYGIPLDVSPSQLEAIFDAGCPSWEIETGWMDASEFGWRNTDDDGPRRLVKDTLVAIGSKHEENGLIVYDFTLWKRAKSIDGMDTIDEIEPKNVAK